MSYRRFMITSQEELEKAALQYGLLPFFANRIAGFSVQEMAAPGILFGDDRDDYGCWGWKGPVIQERTTAYGKFFNRKAGFVSLDILPDFLNYRRNAYPVIECTPEQMVLDIIGEHGRITSTELKRIVFGVPANRRRPDELVSHMEVDKPKRHSLEAPLQRLQMGGHLLISDFKYKKTSSGEIYGWGVAVYSTPEAWFGHNFNNSVRSPEDSFRRLVEFLSKKLPYADKSSIERLLI